MGVKVLRVLAKPKRRSLRLRKAAESFAYFFVLQEIKLEVYYLTEHFLEIMQSGQKFVIPAARGKTPR